MKRTIELFKVEFFNKRRLFYFRKRSSKYGIFVLMIIAMITSGIYVVGLTKSGIKPWTILQTFLLVTIFMTGMFAFTELRGTVFDTKRYMWWRTYPLPNNLLFRVKIGAFISYCLLWAAALNLFVNIVLFKQGILLVLLYDWYLLTMIGAFILSAVLVQEGFYLTSGKERTLSFLIAISLFCSTIFTSVFFINRSFQVAFLLSFVQLFLGIIGYFIAIKRYDQAMMNLLSKRKRVKLKKKKGSLSSLTWILLKKEFDLYKNSSLYVVNTLVTGILLMIGVFLFAFFGKDEYTLHLNGMTVDLVCFLPIIAAFSITSINTTYCAISFEGKHIWMMRTMPIRYRDFLCAKILMNVLLAAPFYIINTFVLWIRYRLLMNDIEMFYLFFIPIVFLGFVVIIGLVLDCLNLNTDWDEPMPIVKQKISLPLTMLCQVVLLLLTAIFVHCISIHAYFAMALVVIFLQVLLYRYIVKNFSKYVKD